MSGPRQCKMAFSALQIPFGQVVQILRGRQRIKCRLHRQTDVTASGGGVRLGAAQPGAGGGQTGPALAEIDQRHPRGQATGPVVERADELRETVARQDQSGRQEGPLLPAMVARAKIDLRPVGSPGDVNGLAGGGDAGGGSRKQRLTVRGDAQAVFQGQGWGGSGGGHYPGGQREEQEERKECFHDTWTVGREAGGLRKWSCGSALRRRSARRGRLPAGQPSVARGRESRCL